MKKILHLFAATMLVSTAQAQVTYQKTSDLSADDYANKIIAVDGGYAIVGSSTSNTIGTFYASLMFADANGNIGNEGGMIGTAGTEYGTSFHISPNGETTIIGRSNGLSTTPTNVNDHFVLHLDALGEPAWMGVFGSDSADHLMNLTDANDGNIIAVGQSKRRNANRIDAVVVKLNAATGAIEWAKELGHEFVNETAYSVTALGAGEGYLVLGYSGANTIGANEVMFALLEEDGSLSTVFLLGGPGDDDARAFIPYEGVPGIFYVAGNTRNIGQGGGEAFLARLDASLGGAPVLSWFKTYGATGNESLQSASVAEDGNILLVGTTPSFGNGAEGFIIKVDENGTVLWSNVYGGAGDDFLQNVIVDGADGYLAVGYSNSFDGTQNDVWLVRTDLDGNSNCNWATAAFVEETIDPSVAYLDFASPVLAEITSTDVVYIDRGDGLGFEQFTSSVSILCEPVGIDEDGLNDSVSVYPNPSENGIFTVSLNSGRHQLTVVDAMGRVVFNAQTSQTSTAKVELSDAPKGVYFLSITDIDSGDRSTFSIVR